MPRPRLQEQKQPRSRVPLAESSRTDQFRDFAKISGNYQEAPRLEEVLYQVDSPYHHQPLLGPPQIC